MNTITVQAFADELIKIASVAGTAATAAAGAASKPGFLRRNAKTLATLGAGMGIHSVGSDAYNDFRNGRMMRKQNEAAQAMY